MKDTLIFLMCWFFWISNLSPKSSSSSKVRSWVTETAHRTASAHELIFRAVPGYFRREYMRLLRTSSHCAHKAQQDHFLTSHEHSIQRISLWRFVINHIKTAQSPPAFLSCFAHELHRGGLIVVEGWEGFRAFEQDFFRKKKHFGSKYQAEASG